MTSPRPNIARGFAYARPAITLWWLVAVCVFCLIGPAVAQAGTLYAECRVFQRYMIDTSGLPVEFDYELVADDASAPMPEGANGSTYRWTFRRTEDDNIEIPVDSETVAEGRTMYTYALRPVTTKLSDGLYYDRTNGRELEYTLEVYAIKSVNKSGEENFTVVAIVRNPDGTKVADPGWDIYWRGNGSINPGASTPKEIETQPSTPENNESTPTVPEKTAPDKTEQKTTTPDNTNASAADKSSSTYTSQANTGTNSRTASALTTGTSSERIAQTGDKSIAFPLAFVGIAGVACLVAARLRARSGRSVR